MRTLILLSLLASAALAEETASDLFYRAFWLEQAGGQAAEAEALYLRIVEQHGDAPETPRALLGLVRLRAGRGEKIDDLVQLLEKRYPQAKGQIDRAHEIRVALKTEFDPTERKDDTPLQARLKSIYFQLTGAVISRLNEEETRVFLADLGPVAHPMLSRLLRQTEPAPVRFAVHVLLMQRTPEAQALVEGALGDEDVYFKTAIVDVLIDLATFPPRIVDALVALYDRAPPHLRAKVVAAVAQAVRVQAAREKGFALLVRALADEDDKVRAEATRPDVEHYRDVPDGFAAAVLGLLERRDRANRMPLGSLLIWADREGLGERIEKVLGAADVEAERLMFANPGHDAGGLVLARAALRQIRGGAPTERVRGWVKYATHWSGRAAALLLEAALDRADVRLAQFVMVQLDADRAEAAYLGDARAGLRRKALAQAFAEAKDARRVAATVLGIVGLGAAQWDDLIAALEKHEDAGLPPSLVPAELLDELGPARALNLTRYCKPREQHEHLLSTASALAKFTSSEDGVRFFEQLLPHVGPGVQKELSKLCRVAPFDRLVAMSLLEHAGPEWGWRVPDGERVRGPGPALWRMLDAQYPVDPVRVRLLAAGDDERYEIAVAALKLAEKVPDAEGTRALIGLLDSPYEAVRKGALKELADRDETAADAMAAFLKRKELSLDEKYYALAVLEKTGTERHAALVAEHFGTDPKLARTIWAAYFACTPSKAVDRALAEAIGGKDDGYPLGNRYAALRVLTKTSDPRRIEVFRKILSGEAEGDVSLVLKTVASQYLIELGEEALLHLRNPDDAIRAHARNAIDSLKYYAEAKKAFREK